MKSKWCIGFLAGVAALGYAAAPPAKMHLAIAREQALTVHRSLIAEASPTVRAKITAAATIARECFIRNPRTCNLRESLVHELRRRFPHVSGRALDLLVTLAFTETVSGMSELDQVALQQTMDKDAQMVQMVSAISKTQHDALKSIIQNLR